MPDERNAPAYQVYFRKLGADQRQAILEHKLGRFPMVEVCELLPIALQDAPAEPIKFLLYYGHEERDLILQGSGSRIPRPLLGTPLATLLAQYGVAWAPENSLGDVINDFLDAFFRLPGADEISHFASVWIDEHRDRTIAELKRRDEWDDIRWLARPSVLTVGRPLTVAAGPTTTPLVTVEHLGAGALVVATPPDLGTETKPDGSTGPRLFLDVMVLLQR